MFGPEYCIPVHLARGDDPDTVAEVVRALRSKEFWHPFVQLTLAPGAGTVEPIVRAIDALGDGCVGAVLDPGTAVDVLARCDEPFDLALELTGAEPREDIRALAALAHQRERLLEAAVSPGSDGRALQGLPFYRCFVRGSEDDPYRLVSDARVDGRGFVFVEGRRSELPIQVSGLEVALASIGYDLEAFRLQAPLQVPHVFRVPEPDGDGAVTYHCGGTQAFGSMLAVETCRAALGFRSSEWKEFAAFLGDEAAELERDANVRFPPFVWGHPDISRNAEGKLPPRTPQSERSTFAAWLALGRTDDVGHALGLVPRHEVYGLEKPNLAHLDTPELKAHLERMDRRLCAALELLASSRARLERRQAALTALTLAATPGAERALGRLARAGIQGAADEFDRWRRRHGQRKRKARGNKDPFARLQHLHEALAAMADEGGAS